MICPKCGAQCPDGTKFCTQCGNDLSVVDLSKPTATVEPMMSDPTPSPISQPVSSQIPQPVSSSVPTPSAFGAQNQAGQTGQASQPMGQMGQAGQPSFGAQPGLSAGQSGLSAGQSVQSPFGTQPDGGSYIPPQTYAPVVPAKRSKAPIIIGVYVAVVAVFLILLFTVIIPNIGGGGLAHRWTATENGVTIAYDFKDNKLEASGMSVPIEWEEKDGKITVSIVVLGVPTPMDTYSYELSGRTLTLTDKNGDSVDLTRSD